MENTPHLTQGCEPNLQHCIDATSAGQAAWAGWKAPNEVCGNCAFFDRGRDWKPKAVCLKARAMFSARGRAVKAPQIKAEVRACQFWTAREEKA
jgi:hypothetical protein